ncbi:hypothetical protein EN836_15130 [Mesorhizobium sp. M1C.F.Ca.ET.193.01.1.1]|uniref:LysR substrate-binding domain-containing protein n=1 Tax=unclassified Mesorhizobium TaxID=325217 RepID=UPI000FD29F5B|nr:hypothetical protein EN853_15125 [Mesorhizobium sp. M1C.F.Ca.ET.210.01.1.1]TGQ70787.1 hypothetical protein EN855_015135 [Mesorhizobium sp. M1C.F.Ca.ET.212.01.1.1]TGR07362.1 hypothetical protein EN847_15130 [Mesorhizobium sp. M1C.F.Ca.ET.204.01.1.1]TGR28234.1 hypothetical protein EN839_15130 [Mesorhizobium sp. M1C.F.Ca.ET.196.01.1.1]TGR51083.1 hypothetical protein EN838_15125 [Mesorhizobium sp. M1C.F.Ca.ET.195.01.1.1]TGR65001.1 hypothetical protein EN835_015120 [Mesorhizobium sp. M1C.F.Ca.ET
MGSQATRLLSGPGRTNVLMQNQNVSGRFASSYPSHAFTWDGRSTRHGEVGGNRHDRSGRRRALGRGGRQLVRRRSAVVARHCACVALGHPGWEHSDATAGSLPDLPLLHVDWVDPDWSSWDEIMRRCGITHGPLRGRRFGKVFVALQAAQANQGVAVGWHRLVRHLVDEGKLVKITDLELPALGGYYMTWNDHRTLSPAAELLRDWLREISTEERNV